MKLKIECLISWLLAVKKEDAIRKGKNQTVKLK